MSTERVLASFEPAAYDVLARRMPLEDALYYLTLRGVNAAYEKMERES